MTSLVLLLALAPQAWAASIWSIDGCGRGAVCPGTPTPTPTPDAAFDPTFTPTPSGTPPTATPSPSPTPSPVGGSFALRIDVGAAQGHADGIHPDWVADRPYESGPYGYTQGGAAYGGDEPVQGTTDAATCQNYREGQVLEYRVGIPNGLYRVKLKFCDFHSKAAGERVFSLASNAVAVAAGIDIYAATGAIGKAHDFEYTANVTQANLFIQIIGNTGPAILSGIEVRGLQQLNPLTIHLRTPPHAILLP